MHRAFSLLERSGLGICHGLRRKHVDTYLNEFLFRHNRRLHRHVSFETLLGFAARRNARAARSQTSRRGPGGVPRSVFAPRG
ncbi:MAG: transposase [Beijerinckiaceae bacterium]